MRPSTSRNPDDLRAGSRICMRSSPSTIPGSLGIEKKALQDEIVGEERDQQAEQVDPVAMARKQGPPTGYALVLCRYHKLSADRATYPKWLSNHPR